MNQGAGRAIGVPAQELSTQVERILRSKTFAGSERLCRFLSWTVENAIAGKNENLKQYTIGREVFDRREDFDPRVDSIVRTEAQRLRRKLSEYYNGEGAGDSVLISYQSGSYQPVIARRESTAAEAETPGQVAPSDGKSRSGIVVLPFLNLTSDPEQDYFCRGIAESIQQKLADSRSVRVINTLSSQQFDSGADYDRVGKELGVDTVVSGSTQQAGSMLRIQVKAIDVNSHHYLWAKAFDREKADIFAIQDEVAHSVAEALTGQTELPKVSPAAIPPNAEAYDSYLRGRDAWNKGCLEAAKYHTRLLTLYPEYSPPYSALSEAYIWLIYMGARTPGELSGVARQLALEGLRLNRTCGEACMALACLTGAIDWRWSESERLFERGLALRPNYSPGYMERAFCRLQSGRTAAALADCEKLIEIDPLSTRTFRILAFAKYLLREYGGCMHALQRALELAPNVRHTLYFRGLCELELGRHEEAIRDLRTEGDAVLLHRGALVAALARAGRRAEAEAALEDLLARQERTRLAPISMVHGYTALGATSEALLWLERAADQRYTGLMSLLLHPLLDPLRGEARFRAVLERMNFGSVPDGTEQVEGPA